MLTPRVWKCIVGAAATAIVSLGSICHADNPVVQTKYTADPAPMVFGDTVYLIT